MSTSAPTTATGRDVSPGAMAFAELAMVCPPAGGRFPRRGAYLAEADLLAIADGDHLHPGGGRAATLAIAVVAEWRGAGGATRPADIEAVMHGASHQVIALADGQRAAHGMRTGLTVAQIVGRRLLVGHVGVSRAHLIRKGHPPLQLTRDHTALAALRARGVDVGASARTRGLGRLPTQWIGSRALDVHLATGQVRCGDVLVMCTGELPDLTQTAALSGVPAGELQPTLDEWAERALEAQAEPHLVLVAGRISDATHAGLANGSRA